MGHRISKRFQIEVSASVEEVWKFHSSVEALKTLTPPNRDVTISAEDFGVYAGAIHTIRVKQFGIPMVWKAKIVEATPPFGFQDLQISGPFAYWSHTHRFEPIDAGRTRIVDDLEYEAPLGPLGWIANKLFIEKDIDSLFAFRHEATTKALEASR